MTQRFRLRQRLMALSLLVFSGCATTSSPGFEQARSALDEIADSLVRSAAQRTDVRLVRAGLHEFREEQLTSGEFGARQARSTQAFDLVGAELEREFVLALANRLHVIETEFTATDRARMGEQGIRELGASYNASHLIVGDYFRREDELVLTVRLINVETQLILSAARGVVPLSILSQMARNQLDGKLVQPPLEWESKTSPLTDGSGQVHVFSKDEALLGVPWSRVYVPSEGRLEIPAQESPAELQTTHLPPQPREDFDTWRKRRMSEDLPTERPWRTSTLAELLKVPPSSTAGEPAANEPPPD